MSNITVQEALKDLLIYDKITGIFTWTDKAPYKTRNKIAGNKTKHGHLQVKISGKNYYLHRLAWFFIYGEFPKKYIDHIDGNPMNNSIINLRSATEEINSQNQRKAQKKNKLNLLGVTKNGNRFAAQISIKNVKKYIGTFDTPEEAHQEYLKAKRELHVGCTI